MEHNSSPSAPETVGAPEGTGWEALAQYAPDPRNAVARKAEEFRGSVVGAMDERSLDSAANKAALASDNNELAQMENRVQINKYDERQKESRANRYLRDSEKAEAVMEKASEKNLADYTRESREINETYQKERERLYGEERKVKAELDDLEAEYKGVEAETKEIDAELASLDAEAQKIKEEIAEFRAEIGDVDAMRANLEALKSKVADTRSRSMRSIRKSKVRALEKEIKGAQADERLLAALDKELEKVGRKSDKVKQERSSAEGKVEDIVKRKRELGYRLDDIAAQLIMVEYEYGQANQDAMGRFNTRRADILAEREKVKERYGAEVVALGRELVGGADGAGELRVRSRIDRASEAVYDIFANFTAGVKMNAASKRAAKAEAKLFARETILVGKREKSESRKAESEKQAQGRELEAEQIRAAAEARRDSVEVARGRKQLEAREQESRSRIEQARARAAAEAENDADAAEVDAETLANFFPMEEERIQKELADNEAEIQELSNAGDREALEQEVARLQARFDRAQSRSSKKLAEQKLKRAKETLKGFDAEEKANQDELALLTADNEALRAELERIEKEKAEIAAAVEARAERAEARAKAEEGYKKAEAGLESWLDMQNAKLEGKYEDRKRAREERLTALLEAYRPEVKAVGSAIMEEEAVAVKATKIGFFKRLQAAMFSL